MLGSLNESDNLSTFVSLIKKFVCLKKPYYWILGRQHNLIQKLETSSYSCIFAISALFFLFLLFTIYKQREQFITMPFTSQHFHFAITWAWGAYHSGSLFEVLLTGFSKEQSGFIHLSIKYKALSSDSFSYFQPISKRHKYSTAYCHYEQKRSNRPSCGVAILVNRFPTIKWKEVVLLKSLMDYVPIASYNIFPLPQKVWLGILYSDHLYNFLKNLKSMY